MERERERDGNRDRDVPAGKQMVAPFIGLFVGSAITSRPAIRPAGVPLYIPHVQEDRLNCAGLIYSTLTATPMVHRSSGKHGCVVEEHR